MSMTLYYIIGIAFLMIVIFISGLTLGKKRSKKREKYDAYKEALAAIVEGDKELAIKKLKEAISDNTDNIDAYYRLGELYRDLEKCDRALQIHLTLTARAGLDPEFTKKLYKTIALDYECKHEMPKAMHYIEKAIQIDPGDSGLYSILLKFAIATKDWEKVENILHNFRKKIHDKFTLSLMYVYLAKILIKEDLKMAEKYLKEAEKVYKNKYIPLVKGEIYFNKKAIDKGLKEWKIFIKESRKRRFMVYPLLENKLYEAGKYGEILDIYEEIWKEDKDTETGFPLSAIYEKQGKHSKAISILSELVDKDNVALIKIAYILLEKGKTDEALEYIRDFLARIKNKYYCRICGKEYSEPDLFCKNCGSWETILPK